MKNKQGGKKNKYLEVLAAKEIKPIDGYTPVKGKDYFDGKDGKDGYTPVKGKDYFDGQDGKTPVKGKDYLTKKEMDALKKEVTPVKGKDYFDGEDGKAPVKGKDYFTKKDILSVKKEVGDSAKEIRDKLETLKGEERLDATAIKHLPLPSPLYGGGGPKEFIELEDVPESYKDQAGKYLRVKNDESGLEFKPGSGGGSGGGAWGEIEGNIEDQIDLQQELAKKINTVSLATVATSGSYNDLTNKPTIPTVTNDFTNDYKTKLEGIATGATKNDTDANLKNRANHTGTQAISTVTGLETALGGKQPVGDYVTEEDLETELSTKADLVGGTVPSSQLPSYVDDVLEFDDLASFPGEGESGKIYIAKDTNKTYRWSGTSYVVISDTIALGETSATAYRGDRGKVAYDHSQITSGNPHGTTASDIGAIPTSEKGVASGVASLGLDGLVLSSQLPSGGGGGGDGGQVVYDYIIAASDSTSKAKGGADATCDGTNDNVEIQTAIDTVATKGGRILLHAGTYTLGASIVLKSNVSLEGVGNGTVLTTLTNIKIFTFVAENVENLSVMRMRIDSTNSDIVFSTGSFNVIDAKVQGVRVEKALRMFEMVESSSSVGFQNLIVDSCVLSQVVFLGEVGFDVRLQNSTFNWGIEDAPLDASVSSDTPFYRWFGNNNLAESCRFGMYDNKREVVNGYGSLGVFNNCVFVNLEDSFSAGAGISMISCKVELRNFRFNSPTLLFMAQGQYLSSCVFNYNYQDAVGGLQGIKCSGSIITGCFFNSSNKDYPILTINNNVVVQGNIVAQGIVKLDDYLTEPGNIIFSNNNIFSYSNGEGIAGNIMTKGFINLAGDTLQYGEAVCITSSSGQMGVVLAEDHGFLGIVAQTTFSLNSTPVRMEGVVGVKISLASGNIAQGDYLSLSGTPGLLKKATSGETVVAISQAASSTEEEVVLCLVLPNQFILS